MVSIFQKIPFLRISLAIATGIVGATYFQIPLPYCLWSSGFLIVLLWILYLNYSYKKTLAFGALSLLVFVLLGHALHQNHNKKPEFYGESYYTGILLESPQEKPNSYKSLLQIRTVKAEGRLHSTREKLIVYFSKSEEVQTLKPGKALTFKATPQLVENYGNPYEFDYKSYLNNKGIYRQLYLDEQNWKTSDTQTNTLFTLSERIRDRLLQIYYEQQLGTQETEILSALTLGYKRNLEAETKRIFSAAGAMHVLAVSGLHVGILFMMFSFIFGFLRKQKTGRLIFVSSSILLLWGYAFITGLSPSVLRATTMFTIVIIGTNMNRRASIYNSLAASAMFLLIVNPNNLFEVGFQLSYAAVFGIVFLQPKFEKLWRPPNKVLKFFWSLLCVSLAAQIATFPLTSYYFCQFPIYFWLSNLIVIPAVTLLIPLGILLLMGAKIPFLSLPVAFAVKWIIKAVYSLLQLIELLPGSVLHISFSPNELMLLCAFLFFALVCIESRKALHIKLALLCMLFLQVSIFSSSYKQHQNREIIVYNNTSNSCVQLISGRKNYLLTEKPITENDFLHRQIQTVTTKKRLIQPVFLEYNQQYRDDYLFMEKQICAFEGKLIYFGNDYLKLPAGLIPDIYIKYRNNWKDKRPISNKTKIVSNVSFYAKTPTKGIHYLRSEGAFWHKWKN